MDGKLSCIARAVTTWLVVTMLGISAGANANAYDGIYGSPELPAFSTHDPSTCACEACVAARRAECGTWDWLGSLAQPCHGTVFGGVDLLVVRPSFSEAVAFARVTPGPVTVSEAAPIDFDYEVNFRTYFGYQQPSWDHTWTFTYTHLAADTNANGFSVGELLVDPFGNTTTLPGNTINTQTEVEVNAFDWDVVAPVYTRSQFYTVTYNAGLRFAGVEQSYASQVNSAMGFSQGSYSVDFFGVGPRVGLKGYRHARQGLLSLFAGVNGSLLVGTYDVQFTNLPAVGVPGSQLERSRRVIPVVETELGLSVRPRENLQFSAGYLVQAWWDLGASGGTFESLPLGGASAFTGADDANIMAFDGFFIRAEAAY